VSLTHACDELSGEMGNVYLLSYIYIWLRWVFVPSHGLSLVMASRGYSLIAVCRLLIAVASLVAEHGL